MTSENRLQRYGFALLLFILGMIATTIPIIRQGIGTTAIIAFFLILLSAWYGGLGPGLLATGLIAFMSLGVPLNSWRLVRLILFVAGGVSISALAEALHAARRRAEKSQQALSAVLSSIGDAVIATDERGRVTFINPVASIVTGWAQEEAFGRPLKEVFRTVDESTGLLVDPAIPTVLRDGLVVGQADQKLLTHRDGTTRPIQNSVAPIRNGSGDSLGAVLVFRDDSDRREHERSLLEANRRKDEFLAMLAHEFRNPLGSIKMAVACLAAPEVDHHLPWARDVLNRQVDHLAHLLDDLLETSRLTHGLVTLRIERVDIHAAIHQAIESVRHLTEARAHRLIVAAPHRTIRLNADPIRLEQILVNLLTNAAKYTPHEGLIRISAALEDHEVVVKVEDNGSGIPPEMLPTIFAPFTQGKRSLARTEGGLGVGLTIVKRLVELHGGQVTAQSRGLGHGSTFTIRLPVLEGELPLPDCSPPSAPAQLGKRILIIDDNKDLAQSLAHLLRHAGFEVETAHDGPDGIEAAHSYEPDILLLDIGLPNLDGFEVTRRLRQARSAKPLLIIGISGYGQEDDIRRSREVGIDHYLTKPIDTKVILEIIDQSKHKIN